MLILFLFHSLIYCSWLLKSTVRISIICYVEGEFANDVFFSFDFSCKLSVLIKKVKVSHSLIAVGAVGTVESHGILSTADERRSPFFSFRCLTFP